MSRPTRASTRRRFLRDASLAGTALLVSTGVGVRAADAEAAGLHLAANEYPWSVFYGREGKRFGEALDEDFAKVAESGLGGFEPIIGSPQDIERLAPILSKHGLEMRSLYVNTTLHDASEVEKSIPHVLRVAERARKEGTRIVVTNPSPIRWGGPEVKNDEQLRLQAKALDRLGKELKALELTLAYHNHDLELRNGAREFHHMMVGTDPELVTLCLDAHWIYRGTGNSSVAVFDILELYGPRITELHLRQSENYIWCEALRDGDFDYPALAARLHELGRRPHLVIEQAVENGSPKTMDALESHRRSCDYAKNVFAVLES